MDTDNQSVTSGLSAASASLEHLPCPYCNSDFQTRSLFRHIRVKHQEEFVESCCGSFLKNAKINKPLRVSYEYLDDFGEKDYIILYADLATNKAFLQESRAASYLKKNPKVLKEHNQLLKELQEEYSKKDRIDPYKSKLERKKKINDPTLCRSLWSAILYFQDLCEKIVPWFQTLNPDLSCNTPCYGKSLEKMTVKELEKLYFQTVSDINKLKQERCLIYQPLESIYTRLQRIMAIREYLPTFFYQLFPQSPTNPDGYLNGTDEFFISCDEMPKIDF